MSDIHSLVVDIGKKARESSRSLAVASSLQKKEALIFGFLGVLRVRNEHNCLKSVTGANIDHSSGVIFQ